MRRKPLSIPYQDQVRLLVALLDTETESVPRPRDGRRFVAAALHHNLGAFAAAAIERGALELEQDARERLLREHAMAVLHATMLRGELAAIEPVLAEACGAAPILIKGPAVADRYYPRRQLRPFVDLDLLVPADRLRIAAKALSARGFETLEEFRPGFAETFGHDLHVVRRVGDLLLLELHWRVGDDRVGLRLDHARIAADAVRLDVEGAPVAVPSDADQLLILALHLLSDRAKRLAWIHDLALVGAAASDDTWAAAFDDAGEELGLAWVLHRALDYARRFLLFDRPRPAAPGPPPPWGPLRAVEEIDVYAAPHVGHLLALDWRARAGYLRTVLVPGRGGLDGTVGMDGGAAPVLVARHLWRVVRGLAPRR